MILKWKRTDGPWRADHPASGGWYELQRGYPWGGWDVTYYRLEPRTIVQVGHCRLIKNAKVCAQRHADSGEKDEWMHRP